jgi:hypothetical protein
MLYLYLVTSKRERKIFGEELKVRRPIGRENPKGDFVTGRLETKRTGTSSQIPLSSPSPKKKCCQKYVGIYHRS